MYIFLFILWVIFNGRLTAEIAVFGAFVSGFVYWFMVKMLEYNPKWDVVLLKNLINIIRYIVVLLAEIIKSSIAIIGLVYKSRMDIQPVIVFFDVPLKNEFLRTVLANSITLTPGTITVNVEEGRFCVHAIDYTMAEGIENSVFVKLLKEMEDNYYDTTAD